MYKNMLYDVHPRYTAGSPAMVDDKIAINVARQEREEYQRTLEGVYGEELRVKAEVEGRSRIVILMDEKRTGWESTDLITGERWFWPFKVKCPTCGAKDIDCER